MATGVLTRIGVRLWSRSTVYVANEIMRIWLEIVNRTGLDPDYLYRLWDTIQKGLKVWMTGRYLETAYLEVYSRHNASRCLARWDLQLQYAHDPSLDEEEHFETYTDRVLNAISQVGTPPGEATYRVVVSLKDGAPPVPGWTPTNLKDVTHLSRQDIGPVIGSTMIDAGMELWF